MTEKIPFLPIEDLHADFVMAAMSESMDWGLVEAGIPDAHKFSRGAGVKVAVLDTGIPNHPDLNVNLLTGFNCTTDATGDDGQGHGTHCSGIVAAAENGIGIIGVAPEAQIIPIKVLDNAGHGSYDFIAAGIKKAVELGADIISMSLGASQDPPEWFHTVVTDAFNAGKILIAAAGNDSGAVNFPARFDEVCAVAAMDEQGNIASFSSRGDRIDFGAAGVRVYSTYKGNGYALLSGTSQACPFIAGVAALVLSYERAQGRNVANTHEMIEKIGHFCDANGRLTKQGVFGYGVPKFANVPFTS
jgi:thermitase